jgi:uncharacterized membrane protein
MNWPLRLRTRWHDLQAALWFRPAWITVLAVLLALTITTVDQLPYFAAPTLLRIGADSARAVLGAIAGAMLSVVGMIFSILMVVLVLASQQFSPRILRNFARDRISQNVLGLFIGSFTYSLLVLARISEHEDRVFTPVLSVTVAIVLAIVAIGSFIYFIDHITRTVRISYIVAEINRQTETLLHRLYAEDQREEATPAEDEAAEKDAPLATAEATRIRSLRPGHIQTIDYQHLLHLAKENNWVIKVERPVGDFVARDGLLLSLMPGQKVSQELLDALHGAFDIGTERTLFGDALFGVRQLVDIALKAISPGVNDPTTAINALDYLGNILIYVARHADVSGRYYDEKGRLRVVVPRPSFATMLDLAFDQIRHYSNREPTITLRVLELLGEIAQATGDPARHAAIWRHTSMISRNVAGQILEPHDRARINQRLREIAAITGGDLQGVELDHADAPERMLPKASDKERDQENDKENNQENGAGEAAVQDEAAHI